MKHPRATIQMENGSRIVIKLLPEKAPNAVNSFLALAQKGVFDGHKIQRIVPGSWIDVSYTGFWQDACKYLIENDLDNPNIQEHPKVKLGTVILGGYGREQVSGSEFVFPLRDCTELDALYPVFGMITEGLEEILRLEKVATYPVDYKYDPGIVVNCPVEPQVIRKIEVNTYGIVYGAPVKLDLPREALPKAWFDDGFPR